MSTPIKEKVIVEGAEIYCERRGNDPLLLLITGGMGDAGFYSSTADILADVFASPLTNVLEYFTTLSVFLFVLHFFHKLFDSFTLSSIAKKK